MSRSRSLSAALVMLALIVVAPLATASGLFPPDAAETLEVGDRTLAWWAGPAPEPMRDVAVNNTFGPDESVTLWFGLEKVNETEANVTAVINVASADLGLDHETIRLEIPREDPALSDDWRFANLTFTAPAATTGNATYTFTVQLYRDNANLTDGNVTEGNATVLLGEASGSGAITIQEAIVPTPPTTIAPPGPPVGIIVGGAAAVLVVVGGGAYAIHQRRERARIERAPRRSQAMREVQLERELERATAKQRPEEAQRVQTELRQQEQVREKRRELQILEAKRADVLKTLDLLKKRREMGGLTEHQYNTMVGKKKTDLERIEAEIAEMEGQGGDGGSAAA